MLIKLLPLAALALLLPGCSAACAPSLAPVGTGLTAIAICMVASAVVRSLTKLVTGRKSKVTEAPSTGRGRSRKPQPEEDEQS